MDTPPIFKIHTPSRYRFAPVPGATVDDLMLLFSALHLEVDETWYNYAPESLKRHFQLIGAGDVCDQSTIESD